MAADYFLKIGNIAGDSPDGAHAGEIKVYAFGWQAGRSADLMTYGLDKGKVTMGPFVFWCYADSSSADLMDACAQNKRFDTATFACCRAGNGDGDFYKIEFKRVVVGVYHTFAEPPQVEGNPDMRMDVLGLKFGTIKVTQKARLAGGGLGNAVTAGYNIQKGKKL